MQGLNTRFLLGIFGAVAALSLSGCPEDSKSSKCTAGMQTTCTCEDSTMGTSICNMDGTPGTCSCAGGTAGVFGNATAGTTAGTTVTTAGTTAGTTVTTAGTTAGVGTAGTVAGVGTAGTVAGTGDTAGVGTAGTTAGVGTAGTTAGVGTAGTMATAGCTAPETCITIPIVMQNVCGMTGGFLPPSCTMVGAPCGMSGGSCIDGASFGFSGMMLCIKPCTP